MKRSKNKTKHTHTQKNKPHCSKPCNTEMARWESYLQLKKQKLTICHSHRYSTKLNCLHSWSQQATPETRKGGITKWESSLAITAETKWGTTEGEYWIKGENHVWQMVSVILRSLTITTEKKWGTMEGEYWMRGATTMSEQQWVILRSSQWLQLP